MVRVSTWLWGCVYFHTIILLKVFRMLGIWLQSCIPNIACEPSENLQDSRAVITDWMVNYLAFWKASSSRPNETGGLPLIWWHIAYALLKYRLRVNDANPEKSALQPRTARLWSPTYLFGMSPINGQPILQIWSITQRFLLDCKL